MLTVYETGLCFPISLFHTRLSTILRSLTLLIREVLAGSVFLPALDYLADPVSAL